MTEAEDRGDSLPSGSADDTAGKDAEAAKVAEEAAVAEAKAEEEAARVAKLTDEEVTAEAVAKAEQDAETAKKAADEAKKKITIPKEVFDERIKKSREREEAANRRADELQAKLSAQEGVVDEVKVDEAIEAKEEEIENANADGNKDKAKALRKEIRELNQVVADSRAASRAAYATAVAVEQIRYDAGITAMEAEHPELNPDNEELYDQEKVDEVTDLKEAYEAKGEASSASLKKALKYVFGTGKKLSEADTKVADEAKAKAEAEVTRLKEEAIKKGIETKGKQPADTKKAGLDADKLGKKGGAGDVMKMSDKDFDKLEPAELARMRGDVL